jgi:broad specificity phosphatase PhoE
MGLPERQSDAAIEARKRRVNAMVLMQRSVWLAVVLGAFCVSVAGAESVWDALRDPGSVVVLRHSYAPGGFDPPGARLEDCSTQRNLDESGRAQAARIGEAFRKNAITVGKVLSSPRCRCLDTARLAFGRVERWDVLQGALNDTDLRRRLVAEARKAIDAHRDAAPLVLVTHGSVVTDLTGLNIRMGEFVVLRRAPDGTHAVGGQLYVE